MNRIRIDSAGECCGCGICTLQCPADCISMTEGTDGFLMPVIDSDACLDCGECRSVCPMIQRKGESSPVGIMAAFSRREGVRLSCSSGGIFRELAEKTIAAGGIVFGAAFDSEWNVVGSKAESMVELLPLLKAKYVQADMRNAFKNCGEALKRGRKVLFCATPCQISALTKYLGGNRGGLLAIDVVCHSVPSPGAWRKYIRELPSQHSCFSVTKGDARGIYRLSCLYHDNPYMKAFLQDLITRQACCDCPSRGLKSSADITLGDFWGIEHLIPEAWDDKGCSLVMIHTEKGKEAVSDLDVESWPATFREVSGFNASLVSSPVSREYSEKFPFTLTDDEEFVPGIERFLPHPDAKTVLFEKKGKLRRQIARIFKADPFSLDREEAKRVERIISEGKYKISGISFRDKHTGWKDYSISIEINTDL